MQLQWEYAYLTDNRKKTSVYHTVNGDRDLFHTSKTAKMNSEQCDKL